MKIDLDSIPSEAINTIGRFIILWNCFEQEIAIYDDHRIEWTKTAACIQSYNIEAYTAFRKHLLAQKDQLWNESNTKKFINRFHAPKDDNLNGTHIEKINEFIMDCGTDKLEGCLLSIYHFRCNLVHGTKSGYQIGNQEPIFLCINKLLESMSKNETV